MTQKKNPLGPVGEHVRRVVRSNRQRLGLTYVQLSERLTAAGRPIPPLGLSRLEAGERRVDVDDLVALSVALELTLSALLVRWITTPTIWPEPELPTLPSTSNGWRLPISGEVVTVTGTFTGKWLAGDAQ